MSYKHLDHIGIAVKDLDKAKKTWQKLLGTPCFKEETVESEKVVTAFFQAGESKIELLGAAEEGSVIEKYVEKRGEGLHHIAFEVEDINEELTRLKENGFTLLNEQPKKGADNKLIAFVHPKNNTGVLVEICQSIKK